MFFAIPLLNLTFVLYGFMMRGRFATIVLDFTFNLFQCFGSRFTVTAQIQWGSRPSFFWENLKQRTVEKKFDQKQYLKYVQDPEASSPPKSSKTGKFYPCFSFFEVLDVLF
jgi:hypothetical protein